MKIGRPYTACSQQNFGNPTTWDGIRAGFAASIHGKIAITQTPDIATFRHHCCSSPWPWARFSPQKTISSEAFPTLKLHADMSSEYISYLGSRTLVHPWTYRLLTQNLRCVYLWS
jgi:hypothetical protein